MGGLPPAVNAGPPPAPALRTKRVEFQYLSLLWTTPVRRRPYVLLEEYAACLEEFAALRLRGVMCIPRPLSDGPPRPAFVRTRTLLASIQDRVEGTPVLSMGMSGDFEAAIEEGSTLVRLGTALFGPRPA